MAMRLAGLDSALEQLGIAVTRVPAFEVGADLKGANEDNIRAAMGACLALRRAVAAASANGEVPMVVAGDHSLSIGSVSGALEAWGDRLGVLWVDAHMDFNTPSLSPSKNLHGMPLAALMKLEDPSDENALAGLWQEILDTVVPERGLKRDAAAWLALRDVDQGEAANLRAHAPNSLALTMQEVDELGMAACVSRLRAWVKQRGIERLWISFDVDALDPLFAPGTGTAVRGGLTFREGSLAAEHLHRLVLGPDAACELAGLDVVEVNPLNDRNNETALVALEWAASLFGKTILHPVSPGRVER